MISKLNGFNINLSYDKEIEAFIIYNYERIMLGPYQKIFISLPYKRDSNIPFSKYYKFELNKKLSSDGLICLWNNINEKDSQKNFTFLLFNSNILLKDEVNSLSNIIGTKKIDIIPNSELGKIYIN